MVSYITPEINLLAHYALNPDTFETITNDKGESVLNEDFTCIIKEFKEWCVNQELDLKKLFLE